MHLIPFSLLKIRSKQVQVNMLYILDRIEGRPDRNTQVEPKLKSTTFRSISIRFLNLYFMLHTKYNTRSLQSSYNDNIRSTRGCQTRPQNSFARYDPKLSTPKPIIDAYIFMVSCCVYIYIYIYCLITVFMKHLISFHV